MLSDRRSCEGWLCRSAVVVASVVLVRLVVCDVQIWLLITSRGGGAWKVLLMVGPFDVWA